MVFILPFCQARCSNMVAHTLCSAFSLNPLWPVRASARRYRHRSAFAASAVAVDLLREVGAPGHAVVVVAAGDLMLRNIHPVHGTFDEVYQPMHPAVGEIDGMRRRIGGNGLKR